MQHKDYSLRTLFKMISRNFFETKAPLMTVPDSPYFLSLDAINPKTQKLLIVVLTMKIKSSCLAKWKSLKFIENRSICRFHHLSIQLKIP